MKLLSYFLQIAPFKVFSVLMLGALSGILYSMLIPIILSATRPKDGLLEYAESDVADFLFFEVSNYKFAFLFIGLSICILIFRSMSQVFMSNISLNMASTIRQKVYQSILNAPTDRIEKLGSSRIIATLTHDVDNLVDGAKAIPDFIVSVFTIVSILFFVYYMNSDAFLDIVISILFGVISYQLIISYGSKYFTLSREHIDNLHSSIKSLIFGLKELKINEVKRNEFLTKNILEDEKQVVESEKKGQSIMHVAMNYGDMISFFVIGYIAFIFVNENSISPQEVISVIMVLLYLTNPVSVVLGTFPRVSIAIISLKKANVLLKEIPKESFNGVHESHPTWESMNLCHIEYAYVNNGERFVLGPISCSLRKGEITFLIGGNGSGKSTLSKIITQHYLPYSGSINLDGIELEKSMLNSFMQDISVIYSDYYLFESLLGLEVDKLDPELNRYLRLFELENKVYFDGKRFSTIELSDGQKRRLALLVALMEDKQLYLLDEWAADQDPKFKELFYKSFLPMMKAKGKAVVVVSHDDRYFDIADQIIILEAGSVKSINR